MLSLADIFVLLLLSSLAAWWWRGRGIGECALHYARQHCQRLDIELLDGNVALQGLSWQRDSQGRWRLARRYAFEFTVTGEQRLHGRLTLYGRQLARIELDAHPFNPSSEAGGKVIQMDDWRRSHPRIDQRKAD